VWRHFKLRRISSRATFIYKWIPALFFGVLAFMAVLPMLSGTRAENFPPGLLIFYASLVIMAVGGYFARKMMVRDLVDSVSQDREGLVVRNRSVEERIPFNKIKSVSYWVLGNPKHVTLYLHKPCSLGSTVSFLAPLQMIPFMPSPVIKELTDRIDAARASN
jgi:hypothetical protein